MGYSLRGRPAAAELQGKDLQAMPSLSPIEAVNVAASQRQAVLIAGLGLGLSAEIRAVV